MTLADRFWVKVKRGKPNECWPWIAAFDRSGYGAFCASGSKKQNAHRIAYELTNGAVLPGIWILHECDNRACCNPKHLHAGTPLANARDMADKGRRITRRGAEASKLTEQQIIAIRAAYISLDEPTSEIAERFGINRRAVLKIAKGERWAHLEFPPGYWEALDSALKQRARESVRKIHGET